MRALSSASLAVAAFALSGCLAKTALDVVTLPVKAAGRAVDMATTSQSEADQTRGRKLREQEERLGRLSRDRDKWSRRCETGDRSACERLEEVERAIDKEQRRPV